MGQLADPGPLMGTFGIDRFPDKTDHHGIFSHLRCVSIPWFTLRRNFGSLYYLSVLIKGNVQV